MKKTITILAIIMVTAVSGALMLGFGDSETVDTPKAADNSVTAMEPTALKRTVALEQAAFEKSNKNLSYPGTVQACKTAGLAFRVGGPLIKVNVKAGDSVRKGDILMQIDPQDFHDTINILQAQLSGARSQLETARFDLARSSQLFDEKVISKSTFDHASNAEQMAGSAVNQIKARLAMARHKLGYTSLKAPYDAIITAQKIENYEMVSPGRVVVSLHDISMLEIQVNVPENEMVKHPPRSGNPAMASFPSIGSKRFKMTLKEWSTIADPASKTYTVTYVMARPDNALILPGMTAEISWSDSQTASKVITVPAKAVVTDNSGVSSLWVFDQATARASKVEVVPGNFSGRSRIIVERGLTGNELIVTEGMDFITPDKTLSYVIKNSTAAIN